MIDLSNAGHNGSHPRCYLQALHICSDKISGEHIISETVLHVVAPNRLIASGFHWLKGEERPVGYSSLTTNSLCVAHNSRLSDLDAAAGRFFDAVKQCDLNRSGTGSDFLFSGHDVERWMLKTTANIVASKNVARGAGPLLATLHPKIAIADMLQDPKAWPAGTGMYSTQRLGDDILRDDHFWLEPISIREPAEVVGLKVSVQGLEFMFFAFPPDKMQSAFPHALYRPGSITFVHPRNRNRIELSWVDRVAHGPIELTFRSTAGDLLAAGAPLPPNNIRRPDEFR